MNQPKIVLNKRERFQYNCYQLLDHYLGRSLSFKLLNKQRRNYYKKLNKKFDTLPKGSLFPVERIKDISAANFYKNYVDKGIPVVIEGAAKEWTCVKEWSLQYFKERHGDDEIVFVDQHKMDLSHSIITLAEVIEGIQEGKGKYYRFYPLLDRHPEHLSDFDVKWLREFKKAYSPTESFQVFIGGDQSYTPLHNASLANLFVQVTGQKHWKFYPHESIAVIDPDPVRNIYRHAPIRKAGNSFNAFQPDYEHPFNLYEKIDGFEVVLNPGDVLYNPPYYWHTVTNIGDAIGVGYRWLPLWNNIKKWPLYSLLDVTVRNPNFFKTLKYLKQDVNLLHLAETGALKEYLKNQK